LSFSVTIHFYFHTFINIFLLLLYKIIEFISFPIELNFPSNSFKELPNFEKKLYKNT
jgi:hypothetical protein